MSTEPVRYNSALQREIADLIDDRATCRAIAQIYVKDANEREQRRVAEGRFPAIPKKNLNPYIPYTQILMPRESFARFMELLLAPPLAAGEALIAVFDATLDNEKLALDVRARMDEVMAAHAYAAIMRKNGRKVSARQVWADHAASAQTGSGGDCGAQASGGEHITLEMPPPGSRSSGPLGPCR
jgi:hypothetical protein